MAAERLRLFVALDLPAPARDALAGWADRAAAAVGEGLRTVPAESLHATLCFLGALAADQVEAAARACEVARGFAVGRLSLGRVLWLPRRRPGVLAVELDNPAARLDALQRELAGALSALDLVDAKGRPFLAHVTVARVRRQTGLRPVELPAPPAVRFFAARIVLFRSHLGRGPARYEPLREVPLSRG